MTQSTKGKRPLQPLQASRDQRCSLTDPDTQNKQIQIAFLQEIVKMQSKFWREMQITICFNENCFLKKIGGEIRIAILFEGKL